MDVLTDEEFIEVKAGKYSNAKKLSRDVLTQFNKYRRIFEGTKAFEDEFGNKLIPP